jgi:hypothetical protein
VLAVPGQGDHHAVLLEVFLGQGGQALVVFDQQEADEGRVGHAVILSSAVFFTIPEALVELHEAPAVLLVKLFHRLQH